MTDTRPAPRILDLARDMLEHRDWAQCFTSEGHTDWAQAQYDEYAIAWEHIVGRLRTVLAAR
jgi:hypothetical protein